MFTLSKSASRRPWAVAIAATLTSLAAAHAEAPQVRRQAPGFYRMMIGEIELTALSDGTARQPLDKQLTGLTAEAFAGLLSKGFQSVPYEISVNAFLVNTGSELILIDAGLGDLLKGRAGGRLITNLRAAGYRPEQVDSILLTHIHVDHVSGIVRDGAMAFPNATIHLAEAEKAFWFDPSAVARSPKELAPLIPATRAALAPYLAAGRVKTFGNSAELPGAMRAIRSPGHSAGHTVYELASGGKTVTFLGDIVHAREVQFARPEVTFIYDLDKPEAAADRRRTFDALAGSRGLAAAAHLPFPGIGHVRPDGESYEWVPTSYSLSGLD